MSFWIVEIIPYDDDMADPGYVRMEANNQRTAEKIERGANINLNHEKYYTRITPPEGVQP